MALLSDPYEARVWLAVTPKRHTSQGLLAFEQLGGRLQQLGFAVQGRDAVRAEWAEWCDGLQLLIPEPPRGRARLGSESTILRVLRRLKAAGVLAADGRRPFEDEHPLVVLQDASTPTFKARLQSLCTGRFVAICGNMTDREPVALLFFEREDDKGRLERTLGAEARVLTVETALAMRRAHLRCSKSG